MWYVCDVLYSVLYVGVSCFVVRGCGVSRRYINDCNCDMFSVVNVYLGHLKCCVVCTSGRTINPDPQLLSKEVFEFGSARGNFVKKYRFLQLLLLYHPIICT